jgi:DNA ligase 1
MRFDDLAANFELIERTASRNEMYEVIASLYRLSSPEEIAPVAYLLEGSLLPPYEAVETGVGERTAALAVALAARVDASEIRAAAREVGDLGLAARAALPARRRRTLTVLAVHEALLEIARMSGRGSSERKVAALAALLARATPREAAYIVRVTLGRMRLGVGAPTILEAVARTEEDPRYARKVLERAYNLCSDIGLVLATLRAHGLTAVARFKVRVGSPVRMMKAERLRDPGEIVAKLGRCAAEAKLDGFRCQVHVKGKTVRIYSRNLEPMTDMFPEVTAAIRTQVRARSAIIDGEALAVDEATGEFLPFQVTVQRKRKHDVDKLADEFPLAFVAFDVLYADGRDLTPSAYEARRTVLEKMIEPNERVRLVDRRIVDGAEELDEFFRMATERGDEGIIAKRLSGAYEAGARSFDWIKLKRAYQSELADTVDIAVVGYLAGRGNRAQLGIGALLGAVYDEASDTFKTVAKVGSGLTREGWTAIREALDAARVDAQPARVDARLVPDVWVNPSIVVTVLADEITRSPIHTAGIDGAGRGLALRFPRVVDGPRDDKSAEDATTVTEIEEMFSLQRRR